MIDAQDGPKKKDSLSERLADLVSEKIRAPKEQDGRRDCIRV